MLGLIPNLVLIFPIRWTNFATFKQPAEFVHYSFNELSICIRQRSHKSNNWTYTICMIGYVISYDWTHSINGMIEYMNNMIEYAYDMIKHT